MKYKFTLEQRVKRNLRCSQWFKNNPNYRREWKRKNKDKVKRNEAGLIRRNNHFVNSYKLFFGCVDCGYVENAAALQLDHTDKSQKEGHISRLVVDGVSIIRIVKELMKCEVRCANCHLIKHHYERKFL